MQDNFLKKDLDKNENEYHEEGIMLKDLNHDDDTSINKQFQRNELIDEEEE